VITLWELGGKDDRRYSLFSWRTRMALRHKGLDFATQPVRMSDKQAIDFSGGKTVPVIRDDREGKVSVVRDSWQIAEYLEKTYPERPLFPGGPGLFLTFNAWVDRAVVPAMLPVVAADIHERIDPADRDYFRATMEKFLRKTLEQAAGERVQALERFGRAVDPMQAALKRQPFVSGEAPAYADYALFSVFQWARVMSPQAVLDEGAPLHAWRERMLDRFDGFARNVKIA
jgi:glutathione S-transferase